MSNTLKIPSAVGDEIKTRRRENATGGPPTCQRREQRTRRVLPPLEPVVDHKMRGLAGKKVSARPGAGNPKAQRCRNINLKQFWWWILWAGESNFPASFQDNSCLGAAIPSC
jgi:hypothetical protein